jgi:hypothetical protein
MAKQKGIFKVVGTLDDVTFVKTKDGYLVKEKTSLNGKRIASDASFARTRENGSEFGRAGKAGKTLRSAVQTLLQNGKDSRVTSRLTRRMIQVLQADTLNDRGQRNVIDGEAGMLQGFNFNLDAPLEGTLYAPFTTNIDRALGLLDVHIAPFVPNEQVTAPPGATHFKLSSLGTEVDFEKETYVTDISESAVLPLNNVATAALDLSNQVTTNSGHPLFLLVGIQFYQQVNGKYYSLRNGSYNALRIVEVSAA